jgi:hypothetical protein
MAVYQLLLQYYIPPLNNFHQPFHPILVFFLAKCIELQLYLTFMHFVHSHNQTGALCRGTNKDLYNTGTGDEDVEN